MRHAPVFLVWAVAIGVLLAGCADLLGGDEPAPGPAPSMPPGAVVAVVTIKGLAAAVPQGESIDVAWRVGTHDGRAASTTHTAVHWADYGVAQPTGPQDYGNTSGATQGIVPASYSTQFPVANVTKVYVRAHAVVEGRDYWSDEAVVDIVAPAFDGDVRAVLIRPTAAGGGMHASFNPREFQRVVGDAVRFRNEDNVWHSATAPGGAFDFIRIEPGELTDIYVFERADRIEYHSRPYAGTVNGIIHVSDP